VKFGSRAESPLWEIPDALRARIEPNLQPAKHPKGGRPWSDTRAALNGVLFVLRTGCQWRAIPRHLGAYQTIHRRFQQWVNSGALAQVWDRCLQAYNEVHGIAWSWQSADGCLVKAPLASRADRAAGVGRNPTDRGKQGSKRHVLVDGRGVPLSSIVTAANVNDHLALPLLLDAARLYAPPRLPKPHLCLDAGYDNAPTEEALAERALFQPHIRRRNEATPARDARVERRRWKVERTHAWHHNFRGLLICWARKVENYDGFLTWPMR
jgi:putative transposase